MGEVKNRVYAGQTAAERLGTRRDALLDAAFELVAADGWRALRIDPLCRAAGLNKRYFYEAFQDLDRLIEALTLRLAQDAITATLDGISDHDTQPEAITRAVAQLVTHLTDDPRRARVLFGSVPAGDAAAGHRVAAIRRVIASAAAEGRTLNDAGDEPLIDIAAAMLVGGTSQAVLDWLDGEVGCDRDALVADLTAMWQAVGAVVADPIRRRAQGVS